MCPSYCQLYNVAKYMSVSLSSLKLREQCVYTNITCFYIFCLDIVRQHISTCKILLDNGKITYVIQTTIDPYIDSITEGYLFQISRRCVPCMFRQPI
jgi:hypothetical protein